MSRRILITGVYGLIGNLLYRHLDQDRETYEVYGVARRRHPSERLLAEQLVPVPEDRFFLADLSDWESICRAMQGMDTVIHMAADADGDAPWESILPNNVIGAYHVFEACRQAGVRRVIYASTIQVSFGYVAEEPYGAILRGRVQDIPEQIVPVRHDQPTRPLNLYGASKVWGEALAHVYAYRHGLSCLCLRLGWVVAEDVPPAPYSCSTWCSHRDVAQLVERCIQAPDDLVFDVFYVVSDSRYRWVDIDHPRHVLGYVPLDRAEDQGNQCL